VAFFLVRQASKARRVIDPMRRESKARRVIDPTYIYSAAAVREKYAGTTNLSRAAPRRPRPGSAVCGGSLLSPGALVPNRTVTQRPLALGYRLATVAQHALVNKDSPLRSKRNASAIGAFVQPE